MCYYFGGGDQMNIREIIDQQNKGNHKWHIYAKDRYMGTIEDSREPKAIADEISRNGKLSKHGCIGYNIKIHAICFI